MEIQFAMPLNDDFLSGLFAIDVGNSRIKLLFINEFKAYAYSKVWFSNFVKFFNRIEFRPLRVIYSSVNSDKSKKVIDFLQEQDGVYVFNAYDLIKKQKKIKFEHIKGIGIDRLLGLVGAMEEITPPLITVDFGTAVTINCVDSFRKCLGGAIFAGAETQLYALSTRTNRIKRFQLQRKDTILGQNTEEALSIGILNSIWGGVQLIVKRIVSEYLDNIQVPVFITGGGYESFKTLINEWEYPNKLYRKNLVLRGLLALAKSERQYSLGL